MTRRPRTHTQPRIIKPGDVCIICIGGIRFRIGLVIPTKSGHTRTIGMQPCCYPVEELNVVSYDAGDVYRLAELREALLKRVYRFESFRAAQVWLADFLRPSVNATRLRRSHTRRGVRTMHVLSGGMCGCSDEEWLRESPGIGDGATGGTDRDND